LMLLSFVREILTEANYQVATASTGEESLVAAKNEPPDLILLDYVLPDMKGDQVVQRLSADSGTAKIPVVYMSAFGSDLQPQPVSNSNVIGFLNKPFTSDLLLKTLKSHMPESPDQSLPTEEKESPVHDISEAMAPELSPMEQAESNAEKPTEEPQEWWSAPQTQAPWPEQPSFTTAGSFGGIAEPQSLEATLGAPAFEKIDLPQELVTDGPYFCGDTEFFSLNRALQTISNAKLTGTLRCSWSKEPVELLARNGQIVLATTRDPSLYCSEAPITLVNVEEEKINEARTWQQENGYPLFIHLAETGHILQEPAVQLVHHYGQKLFAQLWAAPRVRFVFEQTSGLPDHASQIPAEPDVDQWALATLRLIQLQDLGDKANYDPASIPAYTREGFDRVQNLRLTVAEAQFASQFNGARSIQQIAKNLRLDLKFARATLFRFLALDIVECWPPTTAAKPERKGIFQRLTRSVGIGD
jgi:CheY-like chemotaxis protein